ncbi:hypothetical protein LZ554_009585 [Drepanopeziza brunnea f. sp. 'monogermtubi']|nr:hypothetical protein LZ554_009585 [Drepanopeziza brunnea f. sp. 'monogermtubi']
MSSSTQYFRLRNLTLDNSPTAQDRGQHVPIHYPKPLQKTVRRGNISCFVILVSVVLNVLLLGKVMFSKHARDRILTYSPALPALSYERVVFSSGFGIETSAFQGQPSEANNKLWTDLYDFGITRISADEARPMDNKTLPIPGPEGGYVVQLTVFHQLHCLNLIRKGIYGAVDMTNKDDVLGIEHLDHCVDILRQSIMRPSTYHLCAYISSIQHEGRG